MGRPTFGATGLRVAVGPDVVWLATASATDSFLHRRWIVRDPTDPFATFASTHLPGEPCADSQAVTNADHQRFSCRSRAAGNGAADQGPVLVGDAMRCS